MLKLLAGVAAWSCRRWSGVPAPCGWSWLGLLSLALACSVGTAGDSPKLNLIPASPSLLHTAASHGIPVSGMDSWPGRDTLRPGDSASVLVTFVQKKKRTQWLLDLEAATPDAIKSTNRVATFTVASAFGPPMKFKSRPFPVKMRMFGPFAVAGARQGKVKETVARFSVNEDFLALGMVESAAVLHRWNQTSNFNAGMSSKAMLAMNPTPAEQRALCGTFPAIISYFDILQRTDGLEDLLRKLIELPSLWSIIRHRGVDMNISLDDRVAPTPADPANWNLAPGVPAYHFPWLVRLNGEPALKVTLVVTSPRPPLLIGGGVVGVLAESIDNDETYMIFRIISARCQPEPEAN